MRTAYIDTLHNLSAQNSNIMCLISDNGAIVYDKYREDFPEQFVNCGIAEANMLGMAAGLSSCGRIPFVYTIGPFLVMRVFEQVRNDLCLQKANVKLVAIGGGFVYSNLGPTHHTIEDYAVLRVLPGMTIFSPADEYEVQQATKAAVEIDGPVYMRLGRNKVPRIHNGEDFGFVPGKGIIMREGTDLTLVATGLAVHDALLAADILSNSGINTAVLNIHTVKPLDNDLILSHAEKTGRVLVVEHHSTIGGLGSAVCELVAEKGLPTKVLRLGVPGVFVDKYGEYEELLKYYKLDADGITGVARNFMEGI